MNNIREFVSSGIIEMYCMGLTNEEETAQVVHLATLHKSVRDEIEQVNEALSLYAANFQQQTSGDLRSRIMQGIDADNSNTNLPPKLFENSSVAFWNQYLKENKIAAPAEFDPFYLADLPSDDKQYTYAAWAKQGASLEETHDGEDEWLFVLRGTCTMTVNGKVSHHKAGDVIMIPYNSLHKAEATSVEPMLLIGQRIAA